MLTTEQIKNLKPGATRYEVPAGRGLVLRVTPTGTKTWACYVYRAGTRKRVTLGRFPDLGPRGASRARDIRVNEVRRAKHMTFGSLAHLYLEQEAYPRKRSAELDERLLIEVIGPTIVSSGLYGMQTRFSSLDLPSIGRQQVLEVTDPIVARGATEQAARVHATLRAALAFAVRRGLLTVNPAAGAGVRQGAPRERVLTPAEITTWWPVLCRIAPEDVCRAIHLIIATGARISEVIGVRRQELDLDDGIWTIPPARSKNGRTHVVFLSSMARHIVRRLVERAGENPRLLPTTADTVRRWLRESVRQAGIERVTPHDLRRTVATELSRAGADRQTVDLILGHVDQSVGGIYDRYTRESEQRAALQGWADRFGQIATRTKMQSPAHPEITLAQMKASGELQ